MKIKRENEYLAHMNRAYANIEKARWAAENVPGRTREDMAAADAASIIAPNAEAMRVELARRDN